jgi:catechol 2,3-dioxygenase-like lactoylglutathione lyase family enzyme
MTTSGSDSPTGGPLSRSKFPAPQEGFVVTFFLAVSDKRKSTDFYTKVMGGELVHDAGDNEVSIIRLANTWLILHVAAGPSPDAPDVYITPPTDLQHVSAYLEIRVTDIQQTYREWSAKGAQFLTEPKDRRDEIRCYMRDPDGHLIEIGEATGALAGLVD